MRKATIRTKVTVRKFDLQYTEQTFKDEVQKLFRNAAIEFVETGIKNFPALTGQAKAAVINVAGTLGLRVDFDPMSEPYSEYMHLRPALIATGNDILRGYKMGSSKIRDYKYTVAWEIKLSITAASNEFDYFTYWDNSRWHSMEAAIASAEAYVSRHMSGLLKARLKKNG
jgi:hypothetical protein